MVQTVYNKEQTTDVLVVPNSSLDDNNLTEFTVQGQTGDRSYEDRSVYFSLKSMSTLPNETNTNLRSPDVDFSMWFQAEDAIELGMRLIKAGKFAFESNMTNHQRIHMENQYQRFLDEDRVEEVTFTVIDENPVNYGDGFRIYSIGFFIRCCSLLFFTSLQYFLFRS